MQKRYGEFTTSRVHELIEVDGQLGYEVGGAFVPICNFGGFTGARAKSARDMLKEFLEATPNLREQAKAGLVTFSIQGDSIYCHTTLEGFKAIAPGSPNRMRAIDDWMKVNLTPEQYGEEKKKPVKKLEGPELDTWAKARFDESEREIAKQKSSGGRVPKNIARIPTAQKVTLTASRPGI